MPFQARHRFCRPVRHRSHSPHVELGFTATWSPTASAFGPLVRTGAERHHRARRLVARDQREHGALELAVEHVRVGAADAHGRGLDDHLTGPGHRFGPLGDGQLSLGREHDGTHPHHPLVALPRSFPVPGRNGHSPSRHHLPAAARYDRALSNKADREVNGERRGSFGSREQTQAVATARLQGQDPDKIHCPVWGVIGNLGDSICYAGVPAKVEAIQAELRRRVTAADLPVRVIAPNYASGISDGQRNGTSQMRYSLIGRETTNDGVCLHLEGSDVRGVIAMVASSEPRSGHSPRSLSTTCPR